MRERLREAAEEVFDELGAGWSESIYHRALERELSERQIPFNSETTIPVMYKGAPVGRRRPDLILVPELGGKIIVELKAGSRSGSDQLSEYLDLTEKDLNLGNIRGGVVIRFNDEIEYEFTELGPEPNPDDGLSYEMMLELPNGVETYKVRDGEREVQVNVNSPTGDVTIEHNDLEQAKNDPELQQFYERAKRHIDENEVAEDE